MPMSTFCLTCAGGNEIVLSDDEGETWYHANGNNECTTADGSVSYPTPKLEHPEHVCGQDCNGCKQ
jgi:hypothetical protein